MRRNQVKKTIPENTLNAEDVRGMMLDVMERHPSMKTEDYRSITNETFNLLLKAVEEGSILEAVCADSCVLMASNTLCEQLNAALDVSDLHHQEEEMNAALAGAMLREMPRRGLEVAIITHDEGFQLTMSTSPRTVAHLCVSTIDQDLEKNKFDILQLAS
jgi:hypothetical protein